MAGKTLRLEGLKSYIDQQNPNGVKEYINDVANFFDFHLTPAELDVALQKLFDEESGTVAFLQQSLKYQKVFHEANVGILTLWHNLLVKHSGNANFAPFLDNIVKCCAIIVSCRVGPSAKERERAAMVLHIIVQNQLAKDDCISVILENALKVFNVKKPSELFLYQLFKLIGAITIKYPEHISEADAQLILAECLRVLDSTSSTVQDIRYTALAGAIECLNDYLSNFAPSPSPEEKCYERIYPCIQKLSAHPADISQKAGFRAAIELFTRHSTLFSQQIYKDYVSWHKCLEGWLLSRIYEDARRGVFAFNAFHKVVATEMKSEEVINKEALTFILVDFRSVLISTTFNPQQCRVAIKGFGLLSKLCKEHLPQMFHDIISLVVQRCDLILLADDNTMRDLLDHFPDYIQALSTVIREIQDPHFADVLGEILSKIVIRLIRDFHYLPKSHCSNVANSLCYAFNAIYVTDATLLTGFLSKVIFEGVVLTCSHKHVFDAYEDWTDNIDWKDNITFKSYSILWYALLDRKTAMRTFQRYEITEQITHQLVVTLHQILDKLDLRTKKRVFTAEDGQIQEFYFCDPNFDLCPERPKDFHIFINVVDFFRDIWPKFTAEYCANWIERFCEQMIKFALRYPLISGFLKLLEVGLGTAEDLGIFSKNLTPQFETTLSYALKVMIVNCQRVSGELLISTLELVLQYPVKFYGKCLVEMIPVFETALDLGKSMSWLAELAIDCLEKISDLDHEREIGLLHAKVLPMLDTYLQGHCSVEHISVREVRGGNKLRKPRATKKTQSELHDIQAKTVSLLGKLPSEAATLLVMNVAKAENLVKWDAQKCVHLDLRLSDMSAKVYLDALIPRICDLAMTSTDRQTKIAACEVVHALVLYMIGARAHEGQIWTELCKRMLILGSDSDPTVQQIFEPLLMQVTHFMSKYENLDKGVEEIMDTLMDGISSKSNFSLRDLSASCLREFVEWSIKQTTPQQLAASKVSIHTILGRLKMYSFDSDGCKRVGAALAFNNLYRILREDESICDIFFIDLLHTFCMNLKLSEELTALPPNEETNSDLEMISEALDHVLRVLAERSYLFDQETDRRLVPSALKSGTLVDTLIFLVHEAGSRKIFYRRKCMKLAQDLAPRVKGFLALCNLSEQAHVNDVQLSHICEGSPEGRGILARPFLNSDEISQSTLISWMETFLASLECYTWLLQKRVIVSQRNFFTNTNILRVITYYLSEICWASTSHILKTEIPEETDMTEHIQVLKGLVAVQIVVFLTEFIGSRCATEMGLSFWEANTNYHLKKLITQMIFEPDQLNLDFRLDRIRSQLLSLLNNFCEELRRLCPYKEFFSELTEDLCEIIVEKLRELMQNMLDTKSSSDVISSRMNYANGIAYILNTEHFQLPNVIKEDLYVIGKFILDMSFGGLKGESLGKPVVLTHPDHVKSMVECLLNIAFDIHDFSSEMADLLMNTAELYMPTLDSKVKHGWQYFETYKDVISSRTHAKLFKKCLISVNDPTDEKQILALKIVCAILECKTKSYVCPDADFRFIIEFCTLKLSDTITALKDRTDDFHLTEYVSILRRIPFVDATVFKSYRDACRLDSWLIKKLESHPMTLEKKCKFISLLPIIIDVTQYEHSEVMNALEEVQRQHFPLHSTEFAKNSLEETSLKFAFVTLLDTLVASKSFIILEFLFKCTASDEEHLMEGTIHKKIKSFTTHLDAKEQLETLHRTFATVLHDVYEPIIRLTIYRRFLLTMFVNCLEGTLVKFFETEIVRVHELTDSNYRTTFSDRAVQQALVNRIIGYGLIEHFFGIVRKELYWNKSSPIAIKLLGEPKGDSELIGTLTKKAFYARTELFPTENHEVAELFRRYQCAAYTALCSLVSNTQRELKFYSKFLFEENTRKNEIIWSRLIDCTAGKTYIFPGQEMEEHAKFKKRLVAIRQLGIRPAVSIKKITSSRRLQTQVIMESSLSQDMQSIDMTIYPVRSVAEAIQRRDTLPSEEVLSVNLESHNLNKHEVMPMLCGVIKFMYSNEITPVIQDPQLKRSYPWVQAIANNIGGGEIHKNVRVFLAQVVLNCTEVFRQFAHVLSRPLLRMLADECAGKRLNFFITDTIALLIGWTSEKLHTPQNGDEIALVQDLLKFVMKNAWHDKKEILKYNLEIVQTMLTVWKEVIKVPSSLLLDLITRSQRADSTTNECGLIFLGMVLANDLIPWTELNKILYIKAILNNIENDAASVYQPAAYALGVALNVLSALGDETTFESLLVEIHSRLHDLRSRRDHKSEKRFMDLVYNIHKGNPSIVDSLRETICFKIPSAIGASKRIYLEMVLSRIESFHEEDIYNTIIGIGIRDLLKHSDYQLLALHILNRSLPMLKSYDITDLFQLVEESLALQQSDCRDIAYEICIYVAQNFTNHLRERAVKLLLKGVSDPDGEIQKRIYQFWSKESNISSRIVDRLIQLLEQYAAEGEIHFLGLCTQLLLDPVIASPESKKQIFAFENEHDAKLHEYPITTKQRTRTTYTLPPLFAESSQGRPSIFRATQQCSSITDTNSDYVFEPTQDPGTISQARNNFTLPSHSSMPFQIASQVLNRRSERIPPKTVPETVARLQSRRFLKDTNREKRETVLRVINIRQKNVEQETRKVKDNNVALYRRYRYGEYPDLLINNLAFLLPLQALIRRDLLVAKQLFVSLLTAIVEINEFNPLEFLQQIDDIFQNLLRTPSSCESTTFSALLEVSLLKPGSFNLPPEKVTEVAKATKNLTIGALYLEGRLNADWYADTMDSPEPQHWLQLADIYSSLNEFEVASSIFADKIRTDPRLAKAIELRTNGRADEAQTLLMQVLERNVHIEHYYAYNCFYECSIELGKWSHVCQAIHHEIEETEELWTDSYNQHFLLPKLIHARTQQLLEGDAESKDFLQILNNWMAIPERADYIESACSDELMMIWVLSRNFSQCHMLYEQYLKRFLRDWSVTSSLYTKTKLDNLLRAQRMAEVDYYAEQFIRGFSETSARELCRRWNSCVIYPTDSLRLWNTLVGYRKYIAALGGNTFEETRHELNKSVFYMGLQLFNAADHQENYALAQTTCDRLVPNRSDAKQVLMHQISSCRNKLLQSKRSPDWMNSVETLWHATANLLENNNVQEQPEVQIEALGLKAALVNGILGNIEKHPPNHELEVTLRQVINEREGNLRQHFFDSCLITLTESVTIAINTPSIAKKSIVDSINSLTRFAYNALNNVDLNNPIIEKVFLHSVLQGMVHGSKEAQQLFPCVLQLPSIESGELLDDFEDFSAAVPVWMYLAWIPQILSRLTLTEPSFLDTVVSNIAAKHLEALRYPFIIWHKQALLQFQLTHDDPNRVDRKLIATILESLQSKLCDKLLKSLRCLAVPEAFLISQLETFVHDLRNHSNITNSQFADLISNLLKETFYEDEGIQGDAYRIIRRHKTDIEALRNLSITSQREDIYKKLEKIIQKLRRYLGTIRAPMRLDTICPWLANYQWCGEEDHIEMPGQYAHNCLDIAPTVRDHIKVVRFESKVRILQSQRYPLRISIHGSNGHVYDYLVKHGEDLKQDQRIQQILELMSQKLREDKNCQLHNLFIRTYQVIPIDRNCGILSWVANTVSLNDFIFNCFRRHHPDRLETIKHVETTYLEFIRRPSNATPNLPKSAIYGTAVSTYTNEQLKQNLQSLENQIDCAIFRQALMDMALSPGSFFTLRNNFATSLAAMNIAHWVLGVGDRHLQNTLISIKDGSVTGIDFGLTFGSGTRDQPVPELTPFRLTSHLVHAMMPMGTSGLISKCMVHALKVFRGADQILLACMEVFVREPLVNWLDVRRTMNPMDEWVPSAWEPRDRIDIARCKLNGCNPMKLFERELHAGVVSSNGEFLGGYLRVLRGNRQFNERARLPRTNLSVEEQVRCLIDQATDPVVLGICYVGFLPWI